MTEVFKKYWLWFLLPLSIIIIYSIFLYLVFPIKTLENTGQLGDSFGIFNSLFSGFAFIALVITIRLQQKDMRDSKIEVQKQNFENTFFNLIKIHNDLVANFREINIIDNKDKHFMYGGEAISFFLDHFKEGGFTGFYEVDENLIGEENKKINQKKRNKDSMTLEINIKSKLGRKNLKFIETICSSLNLIKRTSFLDDIDKKFYLETLLSQISDEELILIFYYIHGIKNDMKSIIEEYHFFQNIDKDLLYSWNDEKGLYAPAAFGQ